MGHCFVHAHVELLVKHLVTGSSILLDQQARDGITRARPSEARMAWSSPPIYFPGTLSGHLDGGSCAGAEGIADACIRGQE